MRSLKPGRTRATVGRMRNPKLGSVEIEITDRIDEFAGKADLFLGLAQCGVERRSIGRIDLAAGKGNLAGVIVEVGGALRQQHGRLRMVDHRDQHRRRPNRLFARDDLQHAIGAVIAAPRDDVGIDQARRNLETAAARGSDRKTPPR